MNREITQPEDGTKKSGSARRSTRPCSPSPPLPPAADRWSQAHRIAWQEDRLSPALPDETLGVVQAIFARYEPISAQNQVIHGDLCGNILFSPGLPPLVIDFSPAYRPALYGEAILVADAIAWEAAPLALRESFLRSTLHRQILLRAVNFRLIVAALHFNGDVAAFRLELAGFSPVLQGL